MSPGGVQRVKFDAFELDEGNARLTCDGRPLALAPKAFGVLCALARNPGQLMTKAALLDAVWGHQHVSESVLKTTISELRAVLSDDPKRPRYIETASRFGYRFIGHVKDGAEPLAAPLSQHSIVGRQAALEKLRQAWRHAGAGERQLIWISGEAGVGKTTLIESFVRELEPASSVYGRCVEHFGTGEPYLPLLEAVSELCRRDPEVPALMRAVAPTWLIQIPWLASDADRQALMRELAGAHPDRMVREMRELMDRYTIKRPLLFVLEDLHWADLGTLRMMEHFARRPRQVRLMWIASFRLTQVIAESHPLRELRQELRLHRLCDEIPLDPFSEREVSDYLSSRVPGTALPEAFIRRLHAHTDGLPLFVANVVDSIVNQLPIEPRERDDWLRASSATPLPVPDSLTGIVEKQIARLPEDTQAMLSAASAWGMEFSAHAVAAIVRRDPLWVIEQCDALVQRQLWLSHQGISELSDDDFDSRYSFRHALYQHVFYHRLLPSQRVQYHRQVARAITEHPTTHTATPAVLASHYERGHQPMLAIRQYAEAAEIAIRHFAPQDAESLTARGLRLLQTCKEGPERMDMEVRLMSKRGVACSVLFGVGSQQARIAFDRAGELCEALPERPDRALLMNGMGLTLYIRGEYDKAVVLGQRVQAMSQRYQNPVLVVFASNLLGMVHGVQARHRLACEHLQRGIEACQRITDDVLLATFVVDPLVSVRANLSLPLMHLGLADQAQEQIELASARAEATGQPTARMLALWVKGMIAVRREEPAKAALFAEQLGQVVERNMLTHGEGPARWLKGWAMARLGSPRDGYRLIREGFHCHERHGAFAGNTETLGYAAEALMLAGDWEGAQRELDEMDELARRIDEPVQDCNLWLFRARVATARNESATARKCMNEALAVARSQASPFYELKALTAICEHESAGASELQSLRESYAALPEGHGMPLAQRAATLLNH